MAGRELRATTSTAFDTALETVRGLLAQVARDESKTRYRIGTLLREVSGSIETYGARAVERLAERLEVGADTLYRCISVAETWSEPELKALTARTNRRGEPLTWSHLATLAKIPGERTRGRWIERCIEAGWTTRELVQGLLGERGASPGGGRGAGGSAVGVALTECVQNASRAKLQMRVSLEALQRRLHDEDDFDEGLLDRAIREHEELRAETDATLVCLRETSRSSSMRIRVASELVEPRNRTNFARGGKHLR
jgi:hypothetical protein